MRKLSYQFKAELEIIGVNPFVSVPPEILLEIFKQAGKEKGTIPIRGNVNQKPYTQTLVKYQGQWRLYVNMMMLKNSPKRIGEIIELTIEFDHEERKVEIHPKLQKAFDENPEAKEVFDNLSPSRQHEIKRYIANLKTEESIDRNVIKAIQFLCGKERFVGREKP